MFKKCFLLVCSSIAILILDGCASIVSRSEYDVTVSTNAPDANVTVRNASNGLVLGNGPAPFTVRLKSGDGFFETASYLCEVNDAQNKKQIRPVNSKLDPWFLGNFISGGIIGMAIDGSTGAMFKLDENVYVHFSEYEN